MPQLSLPNAPIPDIYAGKRELYKSLGQLLGMGGARAIQAPIEAQKEEEMRQSLNKLLNVGVPEERKEPVLAGQYTEEQAKSPDVLRKALAMEKPSIAEIEGLEGPEATKTLPAFKEYVPKGTSRKTMEGLQEDIIKKSIGIAPASGARTTIRTLEDPEKPGTVADFLVDLNTGKTISRVGGLGKRPETMKEQFIGPSTDSPGYDIWAVYDDYGHGKTELRKSSGQAMPRNIGRTPDAEIQKGVMFDTLLGNIGRIRQTYNPEWVGPAAGRFYSTKEALAGLEDPNQSQFYADTRDLADMLLRARSGAQINEQEYQRLSKLVPTPNLPPATYQARLDRFEEQLRGMIGSQRERLGAGGYLPGPKREQRPAKEDPLGMR